MKYLWIIILIIFSSCSGAWHLKQAVKKGIVQKSDTIYKEVITSGSKTVVHDTVYDFTNTVVRDTFRTETLRWKLKMKYDTVYKTVFTEVECLPDTIKVPVQVNNNFEDVIYRTPWYQWIVAALALLLVIIVILKIWK